MNRRPEFRRLFRLLAQVIRVQISQPNSTFRENGLAFPESSTRSSIG